MAPLRGVEARTGKALEPWDVGDFWLMELTDATDEHLGLERVPGRRPHSPHPGIGVEACLLDLLPEADVRAQPVGVGAVIHIGEHFGLR